MIKYSNAWLEIMIKIILVVLMITAIAMIGIKNDPDIFSMT